MFFFSFVNFTLPLLYGSLVKSWAQNEHDHNGTHAVAGADSLVLDQLISGLASVGKGMKESSSGDANLEVFR